MHRMFGIVVFCWREGENNIYNMNQTEEIKEKVYRASEIEPFTFFMYNDGPFLGV